MWGERHSRVVAANADDLAAVGSDGGHVFFQMLCLSSEEEREEKEEALLPIDD